MIHTVRIKGFKRFKEVRFQLPGHVVLAGPNNMGKTTVLQAIASWSLALRRWRELNDFNPRRGYTYGCRSLDTRLRQYHFVVSISFLGPIAGIRPPSRSNSEHNDGWSVTMELIGDSTEQIYVRPKTGTRAGHLAPGSNCPSSLCPR